MKEEGYSLEPHNWVKRRYLTHSMCLQCGLLSLGNKFTQWAIDKGCEYRYHPSYTSSRMKHTAKF